MAIFADAFAADAAISATRLMPLALLSLLPFDDFRHWPFRFDW